MNLSNKKRFSQSANKISSKKAEFIRVINSLNFSIKEVYTDFIKNKKVENSLINILEKKLDKSNPANLDIVNNLKIYIDLDKKAFDDFFEEAKIIFRKMKVLFNSLKQYLNDNNQIHKKNNLTPKNLTEYNLGINNSFISKDFNKILTNNIQNKSNSEKNNSTIKSNSQSNISENNSQKDEEIKKLKYKLKLLEENNKQLFNNYKIITNQNLELNRNMKELSQKYSELKEKYSQLEQNIYDYKSDDRKNSQYQIEYDLKMMAQGIKEKNFSQDMNIDNPYVSSLKEKLKEIVYKYNTLIELVKNLIPTINKTNQNENIINDIIKILFNIVLFLFILFCSHLIYWLYIKTIILYPKDKINAKKTGLLLKFCIKLNLIFLAFKREKTII